MRLRNFNILAALAMGLAIGVGPSLVAAQAYGTQNQPSQQSVGEDELQSYAAAAVEVQRISSDYHETMTEATSSEDAQALQNQAMEKMKEAVRSEGLSVDRYNQIYTLAQADPKVARQIGDYIRELQ